MNTNIFSGKLEMLGQITTCRTLHGTQKGIPGNSQFAFRQLAFIKSKWKCKNQSRNLN